MSAFAAALLCTPTAPVQADGFTLTEEDFFAPLPTVLSAARLSQPLSHAPVAMTVIDREMIEASSAVNIPELLSLVPGFQVTYKEGIDAIVTYHGFSDSFPRRLQVLVDGRSIYDPGLNGVIWSALPLTLAQIERIEVVRGPNAAAFGSNAFLGTINIISRHPEASDKLQVRGQIGSEGNREGEISHAAQHGKVAYRVNASYLESDGFPDRFDDSDVHSLNFSGVYRPTLVDSLTVSAGLRETDFQSEAFRAPRDRSYRSHFQQLTWNHQLSPDEDVQLQFYHNFLNSPDDVTFVDSDLMLPVYLDFSLLTHRYDIELQHRWSPATHWRVSWGGGLRLDRAEGKGVFDSDDTFRRDVTRAFANVEWHARPDTVVNLGVMAEHFSDLGSYLSPRLAVNWHVLDRHTLRFSAARAYRVPTILELHGEVKVDILATPTSPDAIQLLGTSNNDPERIHSFEVGYLFEVPSMQGSFDVRIFHHDVRPILHDAKDFGLAGNPFRYIEAGALRTSGVEVQAQFRPTRGNLVHLAYAYTETDGSRIRDLAPNGLPLIDPGKNPASNSDLVPRHTLTAMVAQQLPNDWQLSGTYSLVSEMVWLGEGDEVDGHRRLDAKLSKRFRHTGGNVTVSLNIQNLLNEQYWEFNPTNAGAGVNGNLSERRIYAQVRYTLR